MNKKGFAATGILYTILVLFILLMMGILTMLYSRNSLLDTIKKNVKNEIINGNTCSNLVGTVWNFDYTGNEQTFTVPCNGTYKLETWGAEGGNIDTSRLGGYGGYSTGNINLIKGNILYVNVGGQGKSVTGLQKAIEGGYNGGGNAITSYNNAECISSSGGGATHIATNSGILSSLENNKNSILIVSGAGGGYYYDPIAIKWGTKVVGHSGGYQGTDSQDYRGSYTNIVTGSGATQSGGNVFGKGAGCELGVECAGAGGGYYGGTLARYSGAGGSSYIGNSLLTNKSMYCYNCTESNDVSTKTVSTTCTNSTPTSNCAKKGNGYAKITFVSLS